jgi:hypothetical protein
VPQLDKSVVVDEGLSGLYTITLTDPTYEQTYVFTVSGRVNNGGSLKQSEYESALMDFAGALASTHPTISVTSVVKTTVTETTLE